MSKLAIIKTIAIFLGLSIIFCVFCIFNQLLLANKMNNQIQKTIDLSIKSDETLKSFSTNNEKIYLHTATADTDKIIVIDENKASEILTIIINKGEKHE